MQHHQWLRKQAEMCTETSLLLCGLKNAGLPGVLTATNKIYQIL